MEINLLFCMPEGPHRSRGNGRVTSAGPILPAAGVVCWGCGGTRLTVSEKEGRVEVCCRMAGEETIGWLD